MIQSRYRRIVTFFARVLFKITFCDLLLPRIGFSRWSQRTRANRLQRAAASFRLLAIDMGGVLIKVGQFLSSRVDVLPVEITNELAGLQDEVPAEGFEVIRSLAETELGARLEASYARFDPAPLAAASLGQVHRAWIFPAEPDATVEGDSRGLLEVVVKIQRPGIEQIISTDLAALRTVGGWLQRYPPIRRRADVPALLEEFSRVLYEEVDYLHEGKNAEIFAANFAGDAGIRVPKVYWSHTTRRVLTLENVMAIKITDYDGITAAGIDRAEVASRLIDTYLQQIFTDSFFHADPHPGNLFVEPMGEDGRWRLTFIDFGMVGRIPNGVRDGLKEMVIGLGTRDAERMARSYQKLGVLLPDADLELIKRADARVFEQFWGKSMNELREITPQEVHALASEFRELIYTLPFQVPQDLIFLGRAVGILSGLCTGLNPDFNLWEHLAPYTQKLIGQEARKSAGDLLKELELLARALVAVPRKMDSVLARLDQGNLSVKTPDLTRRVSGMEQALRQVAASIVFLALLVSGVQLFLGGEVVFAQILMVGSGASLIWLFVTGRTRNS